MRKDPTQDSVLQYIDSILDTDADTGQIARQFGFSPDHFRHRFSVDYGISLAAYVRRRRLTRAVRELRDGSTAEDAAHKYQFSGVASMSKAFRKEFGCSMKQALTEGDFAGQTFPCPEYDREQVLVSIAEIPELYMVGRPVEIGGAEASERLDRAAWWIDHSLPEFSEEEKQQIGAYQRDVIAMWYHPEELPEIVYLVGPVVQPGRAAGSLPEGLIEVHIPKQRYAVFQVRRRVKAPGRQPEMAEDIRHLCRYIFWEWVPEHHAETDKWGFTFERYHESKAMIYLPLLPEKDKSQPFWTTTNSQDCATIDT